MSLKLMKDVFVSIFSYLSPNELFNCRVTCWKWYKIIDQITYIDELWRECCRRDYPDICDSAYLKKIKYFTWYNLYRSLTLWSQLPQARETRDEFATARNFSEEILSVQVLSNGVIGIQTRTCITYYNINTLQLEFRNSYVVNSCIYKENSFVTALLQENKRLLLLTKSFWNTNVGSIRSFHNVKLYILIENVIYYVTHDNILKTGKVVDGSLMSFNVGYIPSGVLSLGSRNGQLFILTYCLHILMLQENHLVKIKASEDVTKFPELRKYNFLEQFDWRSYYHWFIFRTKKTPVLSLSEILTIRAYGKIILVGYAWGVLHIYNSAYDDEIIKIISGKPVKVYNLMECQPKSLCPILQIDVVEDIDSHKVVVVMPQKIVIINLEHDEKINTGRS